MYRKRQSLGSLNLSDPGKRLGNPCCVLLVIFRVFFWRAALSQSGALWDSADKGFCKILQASRTSKRGFLYLPFCLTCGVLKELTAAPLFSSGFSFWLVFSPCCGVDSSCLPVAVCFSTCKKLWMLRISSYLLQG